VFTKQTPRSRPDHDAPRNHFWLAVTVWAAVAAAGLTYVLHGYGPHHASATGAQRLAGPPRSAVTTAPPGPASPGWKTVWTAAFGGPDGGPVSSRVWKFNTGTGIFGTHEVETMTDSTANVHVDGRGGLDITVLGHGAAGSANAGWTSGRIQTRRLFTPPPGKEMLVTASIQQPGPAHGTGYWPGFWMLGPGQWPRDGEIDILESVDGRSTYSGALHCGNLTQPNGDGTFGPCHEGYGLGSKMLPCPGCEGSLHAYSVIIDRRNEADQQIRWYLDSREFYSVSESQVGRAAWAEAVDHGFTIILDVAVGGSYPDIVCQCASPDAQTSSGGTMTVRQLAVSVR
jgi:beta-glucanase (GH16 family)